MRVSPLLAGAISCVLNGVGVGDGVGVGVGIGVGVGVGVGIKLLVSYTSTVPRELSYVGAPTIIVSPKRLTEIGLYAAVIAR